MSTQTQLHSLTFLMNENAFRCMAEVGSHSLEVTDYACYNEGFMVKIDGEEDGLDNPYPDIDEVESTLAKILPAYVKGSRMWYEKEDEEV